MFKQQQLFSYHSIHSAFRILLQQFDEKKLLKKVQKSRVIYESIKDKFVTNPYFSGTNKSVLRKNYPDRIGKCKQRCKRQLHSQQSLVGA